MARLDRYLRLAKMVRPYTMVYEPSLVSLCALVDFVLENDIPGDFVECGTWKGGCAFLIARMLQEADSTRKVYLCDSFEGMPKPTAWDGERAERFMRETDSPRFHDAYTAHLEEVEQTAMDLNLRTCCEFVKGWFPDSLSPLMDRPIALLRIDCDWYESVRAVLGVLYDEVSPEGVVILDDYYWYDGCPRAVHEYLSLEALQHRIHTVYGPSGPESAFFRKTELDAGANALRLPTRAWRNDDV
jgi:O-methyltransferase